MKIIAITRNENGTIQESLVHNTRAYLRITLHGELVRWEGMGPKRFIDDDEMMQIESAYQDR